MKSRLFMRFAFTAVTSIAMTIFSVPSLAQVISGVMMVVKGDIKISPKAGAPVPAKVGSKVSEGDTIIAGPDSRAKIVMADKNVLNISPDSKIVIEKYQNNGNDSRNVELKVEYGKLRAGVEQKYDGEKSKFSVKTPAAVAGVRGTDFLTSYSAATKISQVVTFSGSVAVGQPGPGGSILNPVFVQPGQMTQSGAGKPPEPPKAVPENELKNMNNETKADTASSKKDEPKKEEVAKKEDKKDDKKDEKKDEGKKDDQAKKDEPKKDEGKKDEPKKEDQAKRDEPKKDEVKKDEPKKDGTRAPASDGTATAGPNDGAGKPNDPKPNGDKSSAEKPPAPGGGGMLSGGGPGAPGPSPASMIDTKDLGPAMGGVINMNPGGNTQMPIINMQPISNRLPVVTTTPGSTFINDMAKKSKVIIRVGNPTN